MGARVARLERGTHCTAVRSAYALLEELRDREVEEPQADARDHHSAHEGQQLHLPAARAAREDKGGDTGDEGAQLQQHARTARARRAQPPAHLVRVRVRVRVRV